jgi:hypothetical protein
LRLIDSRRLLPTIRPSLNFGMEPSSFMVTNEYRG